MSKILQKVEELEDHSLKVPKSCEAKDSTPHLNFDDKNVFYSAVEFRGP